MKRFGFLDRVTDYLKEADLEVKLFEGVEPDPSVDTVMKGAEMMREFGPDWIVAIGGGSPIDAAKAMLPYTHRKLGEEGKKDERQKAAENAAKGGGKFAPPPPPLKLVR